MILTTIFEIAVATICIVGLIKEEKIAAFEQKLKEKICRWFKEKTAARRCTNEASANVMQTL